MSGLCTHEQSRTGDIAEQVTALAACEGTRQRAVPPHSGTSSHDGTAQRAIGSRVPLGDTQRRRAVGGQRLNPRQKAHHALSTLEAPLIYLFGLRASEVRQRGTDGHESERGEHYRPVVVHRASILNPGRSRAVYRNAVAIVHDGTRRLLAKSLRGWAAAARSVGRARRVEGPAGTSARRPNTSGLSPPRASPRAGPARRRAPFPTIAPGDRRIGDSPCA